MNNELTIQDLAVMRSIIDAATRGGVYKAQDLSAGPSGYTHGGSFYVYQSN